MRCNHQYGKKDHMTEAGRDVADRTAMVRIAQPTLQSARQAEAAGGD